MNTQSIQDSIRYALGYPVVQVELDDTQFSAAISRALNEIRPYITDTKLITVEENQKIDLTSYNVEFVVQVYKIPQSSIDSSDPFSFSGIIINDDITDLTDFFESGLRDRVVGSVREDLSYRWVAPYLYLDVGYPYSSEVTIEFVPKYDTVDKIEESYWDTMLFNFALAFSKETLGRIRGKHTVSNSPSQLDGSTLLNESREELIALRQKLREESESFFPEG